MSNPNTDFIDPARAQLRALVATIDRELASPSITDSADGSATSPLLASWAELTKQLALGPEPEVQKCPACQRICMRAASLCGYCWTKLKPPGERPRIAE